LAAGAHFHLVSDRDEKSDLSSEQRIMTSSAVLRVNATLENLNAIRSFVQERAASLGVDAESIYGVVLSTDEAATNIIVHGYRGKPGLIDVEVGRERNALVIRLRDNAPPFDPTGVPAPNLKHPLEKRSLGGLGIFFIRHYMNEFVHRIPPGGGNELILRKKMK
jgi:serine/threonine-protein kinase RsbW